MKVLLRSYVYWYGIVEEIAKAGKKLTKTVRWCQGATREIQSQSKDR